MFPSGRGKAGKAGEAMQISNLNSSWTGMRGGAADEAIPSRTKAPGNPTGDETDISAREQAKMEFSSSLWSPGDGADFTMSAYTSRGTAVTLEAHKRTFSMGKFSRTDSMLQGGGQHKSKMDLNLTFTTADGRSQSFKVADNMRFLEDENGRIRVDDGSAPPEADAWGKVDNAIVVNLTDGGRLAGGDGDDLLFNLGLGAVLDGGAGDDTLVSMGDGASLLGGEGNDTLKVVRDVIRKEGVAGGINMKATEANLQKAALEGFEQGQSVLMDGGDGDDTLESDVKLHDSNISGGDGNDTFAFSTLVGSTLDAGSGNDSISVDKMSASTVRGGDGDDMFQIGTAGNHSLVDGGRGNDTINADRVKGESWVRGGDGDDTIHVSTLEGHSGVDGGEGNDNITVLSADHSAVMGGGGNDTIFVGSGYGAIISGGKGDDVITLGAGTGNLVSGDGGNDTITVGGELNLVDGGEGADIIRAPGASLVTDDGQVLKNDRDGTNRAAVVSDLSDTLDHVALDAESRQRYQALWRYAMQQAEGDRLSASQTA